MSIMGKCIAYSEAHGGTPPSFEKMDELVHEQLGEYMQELVSSVTPEFNDKFIIAAAYKLIYEARYNMLEPDEKALCDRLVKSSKIISTESVVRK